MGFPIELMEKDIRLFASFGESQEMPLLNGDVVSNLIGYARSQRGADADMPEEYRFFGDQMKQEGVIRHSSSDDFWMGYRGTHSISPYSASSTTVSGTIPSSHPRSE